VIDHPFITDVLNDGRSLTASLVVVRGVWPIIMGSKRLHPTVTLGKNAADAAKLRNPSSTALHQK